MKAKKVTTYTVRGVNRATAQEMARYEGAKLTVLTVVEDNSAAWKCDGFDLVEAQFISPSRNDARWRSYGVAFVGDQGQKVR
jgi:hypothetical protein